MKAAKPSEEELKEIDGIIALKEGIFSVARTDIGTDNNVRTS